MSGSKIPLNLKKILLKKYNEESDEGYFFKVNVQYPEQSVDIDNDLPFSPERIKIEKVEKLAANLHDKTEYVIHMKNLKQAVNSELLLIKLHRFY